MLAGLLISGERVNAQELRVRGMAPCGQWVRERNEDGYNTVVDQRGLVGFLSGLVIGSNKDVLNGTDNASIFLWMDNYCRKTPLSHSYEGALELFRELVKKKNL